MTWRTGAIHAAMCALVMGWQAAQADPVAHAAPVGEGIGRASAPLLQHIDGRRHVSLNGRWHPYFQDFWNRKGGISDTGQKKKAFFVLTDFYDKMAARYAPAAAK